MRPPRRELAGVGALAALALLAALLSRPTPTTTPTTTWSGGASCSTAPAELRGLRGADRAPAVTSLGALLGLSSAARRPGARPVPASATSRSCGASSGSGAACSGRAAGLVGRASSSARRSRSCSTRRAPTSTCRSWRSCSGPRRSRPRRRAAPRPGDGAAAVAGLLRPEAWVLAGLLWLWDAAPRGWIAALLGAGRHGTCGPVLLWVRELLLGVVRVAPLLWAWSTCGDRRPAVLPARDQRAGRRTRP